MSIYKELGVKSVVNAAFALTRLGGSTYTKEIQKAMDEANKTYAYLWDLIGRGGVDHLGRFQWARPQRRCLHRR